MPLRHFVVVHEVLRRHRVDQLGRGAVLDSDGLLSQLDWVAWLCHKADSGIVYAHIRIVDRLVEGALSACGVQH